jgi:flagellar biosynthetic protein FlhB/flagellar biosynthesis protein
MSNEEPEMAVALKYDREKDNAPRVVAKGFRYRAEQIRELARQYGVPVLKNIPLAHALMRVDVGEEIPEELYDAVAEVLNFIYALQAEEAAAQEKQDKKK